MNKDDFLKIVSIVVLIIFLCISVPLITIWALNSLFSLGIGYTFWNWLAMFVLLLVFTPSRVNTNV